VFVWLALRVMSLCVVNTDVQPMSRAVGVVVVVVMVGRGGYTMMGGGGEVLVVLRVMSLCAVYMHGPLSRPIRVAVEVVGRARRRGRGIHVVDSTRDVIVCCACTDHCCVLSEW
jgi:hypothetical protein